MKKYILLVFLIYCCGRTSAQDSSQVLLDKLKAISTAYSNQKMLSFDIVYKYSLESAPDKYLDSLRGSFKIDSDEYWYVLDSTVTVQNKNHNIILYKEDNLIYLAKANPASVSADVLMQNPMQLLKAKGKFTTQYTSGEHTNEIHINFQDHADYKKFQFIVEKGSGRLLKIRQVVDSRLLNDPSGIETSASPKSFGIIDMEFSNYSNTPFDRSVFLSSKYIEYSEGKYNPSAGYSNYTVFQASPDL